MSKQYNMVRVWALAAGLSLAATSVAPQAQLAAPQAQLAAPQVPPQAQVTPPQVAAPQAQTPPAGKITPEQAQQLFSLVDELIKFSSGETGLPIKSAVKRQITSRAAV
jgi:hypothetical protein